MVIQGHSRSLILAPIEKTWLMRDCSSRFGVDVGHTHLTDIISYADNDVLFTDNLSMDESPV